MKKPIVAEPAQYKDPPPRCGHRCLLEKEHEGRCKIDDGSAKYTAVRAQWKAKAISMCLHRIGKVGRPSQLSSEMTISDVAEHCGVAPGTLRNWSSEHNKQKKKKQDADDPAAAEQAAHKKEVAAIHSFEKVATWAGKAAAPDTIKVLNPEAKKRAVGLAKIAVKQLRPLVDAEVVELAPALPSQTPPEIPSPPNLPPPIPITPELPDTEVEAKLDEFVAWMGSASKELVFAAKMVRALAKDLKTDDKEIVSSILDVVVECEGRCKEAKDILDEAGQTLQGRLDEQWNKDGKAASLN